MSASLTCGVTLDLQGNLYGVSLLSATTTQSIITQYQPPLIAGATGTIFAGGGTTLPSALAAGASAPATSMSFGYIRNIRMDTFGSVYLAGTAAYAVFKIDPNGRCTVVAGTPLVSGHTGDGFPATSATMNFVQDVAISPLSGDMYVADAFGLSAPFYFIRRVDGNTRIISTYAGNGHTTAIENVAASSSGINYPSGLALDANDNLYIVDRLNYVIRCVDKATGIISTIAGTLGSDSASGDGGPAAGASLATPFGITYDPRGMLWIAGDSSSSASGSVRMVDLTIAGNIITTLASGMFPVRH